MDNIIHAQKKKYDVFTSFFNQAVVFLIKLLFSSFDPQRTIRNNYFLCITERYNIIPT